MVDSDSGTGGVLRWGERVLGVVAVAASMLFSASLHQWVRAVAGQSARAAFVLWAGILVLVAGVIVTAGWLLHRLARLIVGRHSKGLDSTIHLAKICRQGCQQLGFEAANEEDRNVDFSHYCQLARLVKEHLELVWRGTDESLMQMVRKGLDLAGAESLMQAAHCHCRVEVTAPLAAKPTNLTDKMERIKQAGHGGYCVALIMEQLIAELSDAGGGRAVGRATGVQELASERTEPWGQEHAMN